MAGRDGYHHGDLRNALLDAAAQLVREHGARGFSLSAAARKAGVSVAAPYRHFADRDALLAAVAQEGFVQLEGALGRLALPRILAGCASQIVVAYLGFARADPARFEVMFASGIDKSRHPELLAQTWRVQERLEKALAEFFSTADVRGRAAELWSLAHGVATLAVGGSLAHVIDGSTVEAMASDAAEAWAAGHRADGP